MKNSIISLILVCGMAAPTWASRRTPVVEAVEKALPSVVNIATEKYVQVSYTDPRRRVRGNMVDQFFRDFFPPPRPPSIQKKHSLGSGVIVDREGYIVTNYHVVQRAARILVTLADGVEYPAELIAADEVNDLALIKIQAEEELPEIVLARDHDLLLGETVIVLGNPYGLGHTVTVGVLSSKNREASFQGEVIYRDILQTDAAVNPGSSGGPLMNVDGNLIGISVAIHQDAQNIGFAIPVSRVRSLLVDWFDPKVLEKIWLGMELTEADDGVVVSFVEENSPAADAGIPQGAKIHSINGQLVHSILEAYKWMVGTQSGEPVDIEIMRGQDVSWHRVEASELPKIDGTTLAEGLLGLKFADGASMTNVPYKGLLIKDISEGSPAFDAGIKPGLYLSRVNNTEVNSEEDLSLALSNVKSGDWVELDIVALEERQTLVFAKTSRLRIQLN